MKHVRKRGRTLEVKKFFFTTELLLVKLNVRGQRCNNYLETNSVYQKVITHNERGDELYKDKPQKINIAVVFFKSVGTHQHIFLYTREKE